MDYIIKMHGLREARKAFWSQKTDARIKTCLRESSEKTHRRILASNQRESRGEVRARVRPVPTFPDFQSLSTSANFRFLFCRYKYTCCSPSHSNTFTLLKRLTEAANLSSQPRKKKGDMASRVAALLLLGVICVGLASGKTQTTIKQAHISECFEWRSRCRWHFPLTILHFLINLCLHLPAGQIAVDCCLKTSDKFLPLSRINGYVIQEAGQGCDKSATV